MIDRDRVRRRVNASALHPSSPHVAILMFVVSLAALRTPSARFINTGLAAWLFISTAASAATNATMWNNVIVAIVTFCVSLVPNQAPSAGATNRPIASAH